MPAYNALRATLPKSGGSRSYGSLNSLQQRYGTNDGGIPPIRTGTNRLNQMGGVRVGTQRTGDGFTGGAVGTFDPQAMNTEQETGMVSTPMGDISARDMAFGAMPASMSTISQGALAGLQGMFGPHAVDNAYGSPSLDQIGSQQMQDAMAQANARNAGQGMFGNPATAPSPQATYGNQAAPVNPGFASYADPFGSMGQALGFNSQQEASDMFAAAMQEVASGQMGRGSYGQGSNTANAGPNDAYGGPSGVGRDNDRGGGIGF